MRDNKFFYLDKFQDLLVYPRPNSKDVYLFLDEKFINLDLYLNRPAYFDYPNHPFKDKPYRYMEVFKPCIRFICLFL